MEITYHEENGYLIPNIVVGCDTTRPIGKYGRMRRDYLREHLIETEDAAQSRLEAIVSALAKSTGVTEALKAADQMKWVGIMNTCKAQAEELIFQEIIFV